MLTNNFYKALWDSMAIGELFRSKELKEVEGTTISPNSSDYKEIYPFAVDTITGDYAATQKQESGQFQHRMGLLIGSDGTPPTLDDYKMIKQITSGFTYQLSRPSDSATVSSTKKLILDLSVTNTSSSDLTVRELGFVKTCNWDLILLDRTVFDTPVVIAPGATKTFEYRLNMPRP